VTFARRIAIGATSASLVPLLFAALIFVNLKEGTRKRHQVLRAQEALVLTGLLERLVIDMETGVRGFRIEGREAFLEPYNAAVAQFGAVRSRLDAALGSEEERKILGEIEKGIERWRSDLAEPRIAAIRASPPVANERGILLAALPESLDTKAGKQQMDALRAMFDELGSRQRKRGEKLIAERTQTDTDLSRLLWVGAAGFSLLLFAGAVHLLHLFDRRMRVLFAGIAAAERGEYGQVALPGSDELTRIAEAFNRMVAAVGQSEEELRRRAEELQEARERLASILESIGEGVVVADQNGKFTVFNPAAERILGLGATATGPGEWSETYGVFLPDGVTPFPAEELPLPRAIRGESSNDVELHIRNPRVPAGTSISVSGSPIRGADGSIRGGVVVFRDIAERKRAEEALKESEERLHLALESAQMGAWDLDLVHDTAVRSLRHDQIFGYPTLRPEWSSEIFLNHVLPEDREPVKERFQEAFASGQFDMECRILWPDQSVHWIAVQGHVTYDEKREPARMMGVVRDVSERKLAEQALAERSAQLETANRELEAFAYSVSHDLRAPLRAIDGFSQVLLEDHGESLGDSGRDALVRVRKGASRMSHLIDDLLKLSRVTRAELQRARVDLSETARGVVAELTRREPGRRVDTRIADGVVVEGDPALLQLVLENLLDNAFKFTSKTGEARVEFGVERQNGGPVYFVRDNGAGFDTAYAHNLFGAFQRLHSEAEFPGTGIGLATVQRIIHRHGGRVWAEGAVDGGATFRFTL
jgi:PAS domain S-box-containing protein